MLHRSYFFAIMYRNMQKLNKAALIINILCYFLALSIYLVALFTDCYFDMELIIKIGILELVFLRCNWKCYV